LTISKKTCNFDLSKISLIKVSVSQKHDTFKYQVQSPVILISCCISY